MSKRVTIDNELYEQLENYSFLTGRPMKEVISGALEFWLTVEGGVDIEKVTGQSEYDYPAAVPVCIEKPEVLKPKCKVIPMAKAASAGY